MRAATKMEYKLIERRKQDKQGQTKSKYYDFASQSYS
jgi:hypothetical protein